ncbi:Mitochondrial import receptor subunit tom70 [Neolecta irregularis DAH-3]|uniref:Mitochondrial import receptor subunit tom70 n=1 Tax=Neolecta irregularis (strain DAH-3) TaxID=1198029 RepID=A0A1U7LHB9_NEOID|nr:Mitochondrial import receptor subunit tom70 [Neolecta irregularis DAH-3]|eukprot:OLL22047.1 Mitochondrial import receptor subunit tom70 [Neolecta irregularis DAH-3]
MSADPIPQVSVLPIPASSSLWSQISSWAAENRKVVIISASTLLVIGGVGAYLVSTRSKRLGGADEPLKKKKKKKEKKSPLEKSPSTLQEEIPEKLSPTERKSPLESEITDEAIENMTPEERKKAALTLKTEGNKAYSQNDFDIAITYYTKAIQCQPQAVFYSNRAACYTAQQKNDKVIEDTTAALNLDSGYVKAIKRRAAAYEASEQLKDSLVDYTAACIMENFSTEFASASIERLLKKIAEERAKEMLASREAKLPSPTFINAYMDSFREISIPDISDNASTGNLRVHAAFQFLKDRKHEESFVAFKSAEQMETNFANEVQSWLGTFEFISGNTEQALEHFEKSLEIEPSSSTYVKRASIQLEQGNRDAAMHDFSKAIELNSNDPDIYYHRGQVEFILGEFEEAISDYSKSIELDSSFVLAHIQLAVAQYKRGDSGQAKATFRRTIKSHPKSAEVYNYYGEILMDEQKYDEAIDKFNTAIDLERSSAPITMNVLPLINKAMAIYSSKKDHVEAEALCKKALILDEDCDVAVNTLAQLCLQQGNTADAEKYFERSAELARTEAELINAISYAEAASTQLAVGRKYPELIEKLSALSRGIGP